MRSSSARRVDRSGNRLLRLHALSKPGGHAAGGGFVRDLVVGEYNVDLLVEDALSPEFKAATAPGDAYRRQCLNELNATGLGLCLLINFGMPRLEIRRIVRQL